MKAYLSYARQDRDLAHKLVDGLRESGHEIWFDELELTPGTNWGKEIAKGLNSSRAMIVLVSPASMESKEVRREIESAFLSKNFANRVLPVYVKPADDVPWFLGKLEGIDAGANASKVVRQVKDALDHFAATLEPAAEEPA